MAGSKREWSDLILGHCGISHVPKWRLCPWGHRDPSTTTLQCSCVQVGWDRLQNSQKSVYNEACTPTTSYCCEAAAVSLENLLLPVIPPIAVKVMAWKKSFWQTSFSIWKYLAGRGNLQAWIHFQSSRWAQNNVYMTCKQKAFEITVVLF